MCRSDGTGRRARFRAVWAQARVGSNPTFGTIKNKGLRRNDVTLIFIFVCIKQQVFVL